MPRTRIKFCGMTRPQDALAAAEAGADAIGMVLHANSPRKISRDAARPIIRELPAFVTPVGLFVDAPPSLIVQTADELGLRHIQLHGKENPAILDSLGQHAAIKVFHLGPDISSELSAWRSKGLSGLLLDSGAGSGIENDWKTIRTMIDAGQFQGLPLIMAGGLTPENVAGVVRMLQPWAVDVSTGIESAPGVKSREKMLAFVEAVRSAQ
jgi:phosphoribosylanthranilate isomerase